MSPQIAGGSEQQAGVAGGLACGAVRTTRSSALLAQRALPPEKGRDLGRAGIFHRVFRDNMR